MNLVAQISTFLHLIAFSIWFHPLHVSVTEIEYDEKDKELEIAARIFLDDLEKALQDQLKKPSLNILEPEGQTTDQLVEKYIIDHLKVSLDGKVQKLQYLGHEKEGEALIFYIVVSKVKSWKTIMVRNDVLMETFEDQSNLVHVTVREEVKSMRLVPSSPTNQLTFDIK